jgi:hypothetical protein
MSPLNLIPREIELYVNLSPLKGGIPARLRAIGGKASRAIPASTCRIVHVPLTGNAPEAWALAAEIAEGYAPHSGAVVIFRGCEDLNVSATVVQYLKKGEPLALAYGRYCAETAARWERREGRR